MSALPHRCIYRDNFQGIKKKFIQDALDKKISDEEYYAISRILEVKIPPLLQPRLVEAITKQDPKILDDHNIYYMNTERKLPLTTSKRILVEIVQDKLPDYEAVHNRKAYKEINEMFRTILYNCVFDYLQTIKAHDFSDFSKFKVEFMEIYNVTDLGAELTKLNLSAPEKSKEEKKSRAYKMQLIGLLSTHYKF